MRLLDFLKKVMEAKTSASLTARVYTKQGRVYDLPVMSVECMDGGKSVVVKVDGFSLDIPALPMVHKDVKCG